jgi:hypothetical protein
VPQVQESLLGYSAKETNRQDSIRLKRTRLASWYTASLMREKRLRL